MKLDELLTDGAVEVLERVGAIARIGMLLFIAYALWHRLGPLDAYAVGCALFLVVRALRPRPSERADVIHVHAHTNTTNFVDSGARARAIEEALKRKGL